MSDNFKTIANARHYLRALLLLFTLLAVTVIQAHAAPVMLSEVPERSLGAYADYLIEGTQPLDLTQAIRKQQSGGFLREAQPVPDFGIGSRPVWLHFATDNATPSPVEKHLVIGVTWLDHVDAYVVHAGTTISQVHTGDEVPNAPGLTAAVGFALPLQFAPGQNELYLRVDSADPMAIPIELMSKDKLEARQIGYGYFYGLFFGFLAALCAYNLLLYIGLRERSYLYYSLTLASILICNFGYTGHGIAWLWPDLPGFQRYIVLILMVVYNVMGLMFANRFLTLDEFAPRVSAAIKWFAGLGLLFIGITSLSDSHMLAALVAFSWMGTFSIGMFLLGVMSVWKKQEAGRYFLLATFFGMVGIGTTAFAVWGKIPFNSLTFHIGEVGMMIEAALLALALAYRMRQYQDARNRAEEMAHQDVLTHLNNRRAFMTIATQHLNAAERHGRPLSLIMMDIDHFKLINDQHGHKTGDKVLVAVADLLRKHCRTSDIVARWGGEEFILLLTETDLAQAVIHAERLRKAIAGIEIPIRDGSISLTASFGVAGRTSSLSLEELIDRADAQLYQAKGSGRDMVCSLASA